jgi:hypothetical protein
MFTEPMDDLPEQLPLTIDFERRFYFHREGPGCCRDGRSRRACLEVGDRRAPRLGDAGDPGRLGGLLRMSPDTTR